MTGTGGIVERQKAIAAGFQELLRKPFGLQNYYALFNRFCGKECRTVLSAIPHRPHGFPLAKVEVLGGPSGGDGRYRVGRFS
jgi:hypothetical protein